MPGRILSCLIALALVAVGCSTPSQSENGIALDTDASEQAVAVPTALPTTDPVIDAPAPGPTPITLSGGQGIVVPTPDPNGDDEEEPVEGVQDEADEPGSYNQAVGAGSDTDDSSESASDAADPTATPVPEPTTAGSYNQAIDAGGDSTEAAAASPTAVPATPTPAPTASAGTSDDTADDSADPVVNIANGGEVYTLNCARCHGEDGLGSIYRTIIGTGSKFSQDALVQELTTGHAFTFGFGDKLSATEIRDVVAYVRASFG